MNSEKPPGKKWRLTTEAKAALAFGIISLVLSLSASLALFLNWDIPPGDIKGPHPWMATVGHYLVIGGFYGFMVTLPVSFFALITGFFNKPRLVNVAAGCLSLIIAYFAGTTVLLTIVARGRQAAKETPCFNMRALGYALRQYGREYNGRIPQAINWCDELIVFDVNSAEKMRKGWIKNDEGLSDFAINANLSELKLNELPKDMVLLYETKLSKNPAGGAELINAENHPLKGCFILFTDMRVEFVRAEDFNNLRWKP